ncbi:hypothetical protein EMCRGX_G023684 [Ephydatia muelleri]
MHSGDLGALGEATLSEAEKNALLQVMQRAKEFDQAIAHKAAQESTPLEGTLLKWTNVVKGWQSRWIRLDQQQAVLHYYASEDRKKQAPRGSLHLWGAVVAPSDEDAQTFTISGANGEEYKLRAGDSKERQLWVVRLRREIEDATNIIRASKESPRIAPAHSDASKTLKAEHLQPTKTPATPSNHSKSPPPSAPPPRPTPYSAPRPPKSPVQPSSQGSKSPDHQKPVPTHMENVAVELGEGEELPGGDAMFELFTRVYCAKESMVLQLESCGVCGLDPLEKNVLLLKATSHAALASVKECLGCLKSLQHEQLTGSFEHLNKDLSVSNTSGRPSSASDLNRPQSGSHKLRKKHKTTAAL